MAQIVPAYNFMLRFAPRVRRGDKTHTIRGKRKRQIRAGDAFYGFTGLRTKRAQRLITSVVVKVEDIAIQPGRIFIDGVRLDKSECEGLARRDGFDDFADMMAFWNGRLPFTGDIIHWKFPPEKPHRRR